MCTWPYEATSDYEAVRDIGNTQGYDEFCKTDYKLAGNGSVTYWRQNGTSLCARMTLVPETDIAYTDSKWSASFKFKFGYTEDKDGQTGAEWA